MSSIKVSPQHGVNPTLLKCPVCWNNKGVALMGQLPGDEEAPRELLDNQPCDECEEFMERGIILISVRDGESGNNPYRTGAFVVMAEEGVKRFVKEPALSQVLAARISYVPDLVWDSVGLPREPKAEGAPGH